MKADDPTGIDDDARLVKVHIGGPTMGERILMFGTLLIVIPLAVFCTWYWR